jgi:hypothetical protein
MVQEIILSKMLKDKFLYRKVRKGSESYYKRPYSRKGIDIYSDLPFHEPIRKTPSYRVIYDYTPLEEFIKSKIGCDWNDVYSEILTKINKRYRYDLIDNIYWIIKTSPLYDKDYIPRSFGKYPLYDDLFVDLDNKITKKSKQELINDSIRIKRKIKLSNILLSLEEDSTEPI